MIGSSMQNARKPVIENFIYSFFFETEKQWLRSKVYNEILKKSTIFSEVFARPFNSLEDYIL